MSNSSNDDFINYVFSVVSLLLRFLLFFQLSMIVLWYWRAARQASPRGLDLQHNVIDICSVTGTVIDTLVMCRLEFYDKIATALRHPLSFVIKRLNRTELTVKKVLDLSIF